MSFFKNNMSASRSLFANRVNNTNNNATDNNTTNPPQLTIPVLRPSISTIRTTPTIQTSTPTPQIKKPKVVNENNESSTRTNIKQTLKKQPVDDEEKQKFNYLFSTTKNITNETSIKQFGEHFISQKKNNPYFFISLLSLNENDNIDDDNYSNFDQLSDDAKNDIQSVLKLQRLLSKYIKIFNGIQNIIDEYNSQIEKGDNSNLYQISTIKRLIDKVSKNEQVHDKEIDLKYLMKEVQNDFKSYLSSSSINSLENYYIDKDGLIQKKRMAKSIENATKKRALSSSDNEDDGYNFSEEEIDIDSLVESSPANNNLYDLNKFVSNLDYIKIMIHYIITSINRLILTFRSTNGTQNFGFIDFIMLENKDEKNKESKLFVLTNEENEYFINNYSKIGGESLKKTIRTDDNFLGLEIPKSLNMINIIYNLIVKRQQSLEKSIKRLKGIYTYLILMFSYLSNISLCGELKSYVPLFDKNEKSQTFIRELKGKLTIKIALLKKMISYLKNQYLAHSRFLLYIIKKFKNHDQKEKINECKKSILFILNFLRHSIEKEEFINGTNTNILSEAFQVYSKELKKIIDIELDIKKFSINNLKIKAAQFGIDFSLDVNKVDEESKNFKFKDKLNNTSLQNKLFAWENFVNDQKKSGPIKLFIRDSQKNPDDVTFVNYLYSDDNNKVKFNALSIFYIETKLELTLSNDAKDRLVERAKYDEFNWFLGSNNLIKKQYNENMLEKDNVDEIIIDENVVNSIARLAEFFFITNQNTYSQESKLVKKNETVKNLFFQYNRNLKVFGNYISNQFKYLFTDTYLYNYCKNDLKGFSYGLIFKDFEIGESLSMLGYVNDLYKAKNFENKKELLFGNDELGLYIDKKIEYINILVTNVKNEIFKYGNFIHEKLIENFSEMLKTLTNNDNINIDQLKNDSPKNEIVEFFTLLFTLLSFYQGYLSEDKNNDVLIQEINGQVMIKKKAIFASLSNDYKQFVNVMFEEIFEYLYLNKEKKKIELIFEIFEKASEMVSANTTDVKKLRNRTVDLINKMHIELYPCVLWFTFKLNQSLNTIRDDSDFFLLKDETNYYKDGESLETVNVTKIDKNTAEIFENYSKIEKKYMGTIDNVEIGKEKKYLNIYKYYEAQQNNLSSFAEEIFLRRSRYILYSTRHHLLTEYNNFEEIKTCKNIQRLLKEYDESNINILSRHFIQSPSSLKYFSKIKETDNKAVKSYLKITILRLTYLINFINLLLYQKFINLTKSNETMFQNYKLSVTKNTIEIQNNPVGSLAKFIQKFCRFLAVNTHASDVLKDNFQLSFIKNSIYSDQDFLKIAGNEIKYKKLFDSKDTDRKIKSFIDMQTTTFFNTKIDESEKIVNDLTDIVNESNSMNINLLDNIKIDLNENEINDLNTNSMEVEDSDEENDFKLYKININPVATVLEGDNLEQYNLERGNVNIKNYDETIEGIDMINEIFDINSKSKNEDDSDNDDDDT